MDLTALAYTSTATANLRTAGAMDELLLKARAFNSQVGVTGVLLHNDGTFFQYTEGPTQAVEEVYRRILKSPGHCHVYELFRDRISQCQFFVLDHGIRTTQRNRTASHCSSSMAPSTSHARTTVGHHARSGHLAHLLAALHPRDLIEPIAKLHKHTKK